MVCLAAYTKSLCTCLRAAVSMSEVWGVFPCCVKSVNKNLIQISIQRDREVKGGRETDVLWKILGGVGSSSWMLVLNAIHSRIVFVCLHYWASIPGLCVRWAGSLPVSCVYVYGGRGHCLHPGPSFYLLSASYTQGDFKMDLSVFHLSLELLKLPCGLHPVPERAHWTRRAHATDSLGSIPF